MNEYTIISAEYANEEHNAIIIETKEFGTVMVTERDRPELWQHTLNQNLEIKPYSAPVIVKPEPKNIPVGKKQAGPNVIA
jgi:hypothetical protein